MSLWDRDSVGVESRPRFARSFPRRGCFFRAVAHGVTWAFLAQVLPATAFADLSIPARIPIAEWRAAMRKERRIELLCALIPLIPNQRSPKQRDQMPEEFPRRASPHGAFQLRVSTRIAPFTRETPEGVYHCVENTRRFRQVAWDGHFVIPNAAGGRGRRDVFGLNTHGGIFVSPPVVAIPTPNPSHQANGESGRGSWHVGRWSRSFVPRPDIRLTAEMGRMPSSPSAPSGTRPLGVDLDVADMVVNGSVQRMILATSPRREASLILATGADPYPMVRRAIPGVLVTSAVALTKVEGRDLAIVGGFKDGKWGIATIDLSPLAAPIPQGQQPPDLPMLWFTEIPGLTGIGDIEMLGATAVVTSQVGIGKATLIDINVTTPPVISGQIDGVASRVAVSDRVLFSVDGRISVPGTGTSSALHGIKTAVLQRFAYIKKPRTAFMRPVEGDPDREELSRNVPIPARMIPASDVALAEMEVRNNGERVIGPVVLPLGVVASQDPFAPLAPFTTDYIYVLQEQFQRARNAVTEVIAKFTLTDGSQMETRVTKLDLGQISPRVDSNNDTLMGRPGSAADLADQNASEKPFVFWAGDMSIYRRDDKYLDYGRLSIRRFVPLSARTRVGIRIAGGDWDLMERVTIESGPLPEGCDSNEDRERIHLCSNAIAVGQAQRELFAVAGTDPIVEVSRGLYEVPKKLLRDVSNEFLFRCHTRADGGSACPNQPTKDYGLEVGEILPGDVFQPVASAKIQILPFKKLFSAVSLRRSPYSVDDPSSDHQRVRTTPIENEVVAGWAALPFGSGPKETVKTANVLVHGYNVSQAAFLEPSNGVPGGFASWVKKFYWTGQKVLEAQGATTIGVVWPGNVPGTLQLLYFPEDEFNALQAGIPFGQYLAYLRQGKGLDKINILAHSLGNLVVNSALTEMRPVIASSGVTDLAKITYVMNEAAVPAEAFVAAYNPTRESLAGVPGLLDLVRRARDLGYADAARGRPLGDEIYVEQENLIVETQQNRGCPRSAVLQFDAATCEAQRTSQAGKTPMAVTRECECEAVTRYFQGLQDVDPDSLVEALELPDISSNAFYRNPFFTQRWRKYGPRGSWGGTLATNLSDPMEGVKIFTTFNRTDAVLRADAGLVSFLAGEKAVHAWRALQFSGKPYDVLYGPALTLVATFVLSASFATATVQDGMFQQRWWTFQVDGDGRPNFWSTSRSRSTDHAAVWQDFSPQQLSDPAAIALPPVRQRLVQTRNWAERSMWFSALAPPAGVLSLSQFGAQVRETTVPQPILFLGVPFFGKSPSFANLWGEFDFTDIGGQLGPTTSHSYLYELPLPKVWKGYKAIRWAFER